MEKGKIIGTFSVASQHSTGQKLKGKFRKVYTFSSTKKQVK